ncbi:hypothetical protein V8E54_000670 [Elaphomyces granulatus]
MNLLLRNQRAERQAYEGTKTEGKKFEEYLVFITAYVLGSFAPRCSSEYRSNLGLFLHSCGLSRKGLDRIAGMGVIPSYTHLNRRLTRIAKHAENKLPRLAFDPQLVIAYDNFNFKDTVRNQSIEHSAVMQNLTSALAVSSPYLPSTGLKQSMLDFHTTFSLTKLQCREGFRESQRSVKAAKRFIFTTIRSIHGDAINRIVDEGQLDNEFRMLTFEDLPPEKMKVHLLGAVFKGEGTVAGTQEVYNEIFLNKPRMIKDPAATGDTRSPHLPAEPVDAFQTRLFIVHGDEKTSSLIRSAKYNNRNSRRAFDRRQWLLCAPGMFHVQQACMLSIVRTHWDSDGRPSRATITHDIGYFDRRGISQANARFHEIEPLLQRGFAARAAWDGVGVKDRELVGTYRKFSTFRSCGTPRHGDIGLIDFLIDPLLLIFCGAGQHKYSFELLHFRWLLCASSAELRRSLLASTLINEIGKAGSFKAIDLALELVSARYARTIKAHKNSRHELRHIFHRLSLVQTEIHSINSRLQTDYGRLTSNKHVFTRAQADIFSLACFLEVHHTTGQSAQSVTAL